MMKKKKGITDIIGSAQLSAILGTAHVLRKMLCFWAKGISWDMTSENPGNINWWKMWNNNNNNNNNIIIIIIIIIIIYEDFFR